MSNANKLKTVVSQPRNANFVPEISIHADFLSSARCQLLFLCCNKKPENKHFAFTLFVDDSVNLS